MTDTVTVHGLRAANIARQAEWDPSDKITLSYRLNELAGETGEACNVGKKIERERLGIRGSRDTLEHLGEELADVVICADLVAMAEGIDLDAAIEAKFNATSEKVGLSTRLTFAVLLMAEPQKGKQKPVGEIFNASSVTPINRNEVRWSDGRMPKAGTKLYDHPAPSSDELLEALHDLSTWFTKPVQGLHGPVWAIRAGEQGADAALEVARCLIAKHKGPQS